MENEVLSMSRAIISQMEQNGIAHSTIKVYEHTVFSPVLQRYDELGKTFYDQDVLNELMAMYDQQLEAEVISKPLYNWRKRGVLLLQDFRATGEVHQGKYVSREISHVPDFYAGIMQEFSESLQADESTKEKVKAIARKFLICLAEWGIKNLYELRAENVRRFIEIQHEETPKNIGFVVYAMRHFFRFLESTGYDIRKIWILLAFPGRAKTVKPTFTEEELMSIIAGIDRTSAPGKRDFAILSLAMTTGIRAGDLTQLRLTDIKWTEGEINIIQQKTKRALTLLLLKPVAAALADYILNERPESKLPNVFLTCRAPYRTFNKGTALDGIIKKYMGKAGVEHKEDDGKTFHGLRRFLGTGIVSKGGTTTMAADLLGHSSISATRQYISVDMNGLRRCVLSRSTLGGVL